MTEIREAFAEPLAHRLGRPVEDIREEGLRAGDFRGNEEVFVTMTDGSTFQLRYAFFVEDGEGSIGIFSEHSGYHAFGMIGLDIEQRRDGVVVAAHHS